MRREGDECWVDVHDDDRYEVSNTGRVRNKKTGRILTPQLNKRSGGYERVTFGSKRDYVHRIVAKSFLDCDIKGRDVNHIDGDKRNNNIANLEVCNRKENIKHAFINGLAFPHTVKVVRCKFCTHRYDFDHCHGKPDSYYCADGRRD